MTGRGKSNSTPGKSSSDVFTSRQFDDLIQTLARFPPVPKFFGRYLFLGSRTGGYKIATKELLDSILLEQVSSREG